MATRAHAEDDDSSIDGKRPPSKSDFYSNEELQAIFNLHNELSEEFQKTPDTTSTSSSTSTIPSIHDLVLQSLQQDESHSTTTTTTTNDSIQISPELQQRLLNIRAIASDVDGTLLTSDHQLHPITAAALQQILQAVQDPALPLEYFFLATGKTRPGALRHIPSQLELHAGVYSQGLYCVIGPNDNDDEQQQVVFSQTLPAQAVQAAEQFAKQHQLTLLGYYADQIFATADSCPQHLQDIHSKYGEPVPILLETFGGRQWNKLIWMGHDNDILQNVYRPLLNQLAETHGATTTQAVPLMIELLPANCNKGVGVRKLCQALGIDPETELLAIGDGENDKEMLEMAACGIALGNAVRVTKEAADICLVETNNEGGAGIALERFGLRRGLAADEYN